MHAQFYKTFFLSIAIFWSGIISAQPSIGSFSPSSGPVGTTVTINGTNFSSVAAENIVYFGATRAKVNSATNSTLVVKVPAGATFEPITVTTSNLTAYSTSVFVTSFAGGSVDSATFQTRMDLPVLQGAYSLAVGDLDGDGKPDIAYGNFGTGGFTGSYLSVLPNTSTTASISFGQRLDFLATGTVYDLKIADLNGDGKPEIITGNTNANSFSVYQNTSSPGAISFAPSKVIYTVASARGITVADFDGDGLPDVLTVNPPLVSQTSNLSIFRNTGANGAISFATKIDFPITVGVTRVSAADMDNDGKVDLIYSNNNNVSVFKNTSAIGNISFGSKTDLGVDSRVTSTGDLDGDGKADIAVVVPSGINFYRNTGTTGSLALASPVNINVGTTFYQTLLSDIDGDGKPDLIGFNEKIDFASVLKNNSTPGNISFAGNVGYGTAARLFYLASADLDGDSKPEIISYNMSDYISVLRNKTGEPTTVASGANPVTGTVENTVMVDESVQSYNGNAYVQRHYDIEPEINPATSTATITIYFTQLDFDNYNAFPTSKLMLPAGPNDNAGKANLRINQYHGTSSSGVPGTYSGSGVEIDPDDSKIVWNDLLKRWEVTFDVTGFSGFFISSSSIVALPLKMLSFDAAVKNDNALLQWTTTNELNVDYFELQRSTDGVNFNLLSKLTPKGISNSNTQYNYTDKLTVNDIYYYRLKITDKDGSSTFSSVIKITFSSERNEFLIYPNPTHGSAMVQMPNVSDQSELRIVDMSGKTIKNLLVPKNSTQARINLGNIKPGTYKMLWTDGITSKVQTLVIE